MGESTGIAWTDSTFNPWRGCQRVSPGCENCYAETLSHRNPALLGQWGPPSSGGTRIIASPSMWREPLKWNVAAAKSGKTHRVFCSSLADVFEDLRELDLPRQWLWHLIVATPHLTWLLLTKRPQHIRNMVPAQWVHNAPEWPRNVWVGATVEDQKRADERIPWLVEIPAPVRFLSVEPQLGPVDLTNIRIRFSQYDDDPDTPKMSLNALTGHVIGPDDITDMKVQWVIQGGESGGGARQFDLDWAHTLRDQCAKAGVAYFFKQMGKYPMGFRNRDTGGDFPTHPAGADQVEMPSDLRIQQFPEVANVR